MRSKISTINSIVVAMLVAGTQCYYVNDYANFWGWCPQRAEVYPNPDAGIQYKLLTEPIDDEGTLNTIGDIKCSDENIALAGSVFEDGPMKGHFNGYPGGQCAFVRDEEDCDMESMVDFLEVFYCTFQDTFCSRGKSFIMLPLAFLLIFIAMWNLGSTADAYLSPALEAVSDKLSCSESLAGVTLLALGNGAPDVFAAIAAGGDEDGLNLQVSSLIGSSFFIACVVMALALRAAPDQKIQVTRNFFLRDVFFLLITCVYLIVILCVLESINIGTSLGFFVIYFTFVGTVIIQSKFFNKVEEGEEDIAEQTKKAIDYSNLIAFKRQEFKKGKALIEDDDGHPYHAGGSTYSKGVPQAIKSVYSKKVPKDILNMDDKLGKKYIKQGDHLSRGFTKQKTLNLGDNDDLSMRLNARQESNSAYAKNRNESHYQQQDIIQVPQISNDKDELIRYQSITNMDKAAGGHINESTHELNASVGQEKGAGNMLNLDDQVTAYRQQKQGSVQVVSAVMGPNIQEHVRESTKPLMGGDEGQAVPEQFYAAQKLKIQFKRAQSDESKLDKCWKIVEVPFNFFRDFSIPMAEYDDWDRFRASVLPLTVPISFMFLWKLLTEDSETTRLCLIVAGILAAPGAVASIYLCFCTKKTQPPPTIMFIFAIFGFIMSIVWIAFTSDFVVDLLWIIGLILGIPKSLLGLTLLAVGNCLGDMNANVAMTKKGFGEMAVTGCLAGPVFNILFGLGISLTLALLNNSEKSSFRWSLYNRKNELDTSSIVPLTLLCSLSIVLVMVLFNGIVNKFYLVFKMHTISLLFYIVAIIGLCVFVGVLDVK